MHSLGGAESKGVLDAPLQCASLETQPTSTKSTIKRLQKELQICIQVQADLRHSTTIREDQVIITASSFLQKLLNMRYSHTCLCLSLHSIRALLESKCVSASFIPSLPLKGSLPSLQQYKHLSNHSTPPTTTYNKAKDQPSFSIPRALSPHNTPPVLSPQPEASPLSSLSLRPAQPRSAPHFNQSVPFYLHTPSPAPPVHHTTSTISQYLHI